MVAAGNHEHRPWLRGSLTINSRTSLIFTTCSYQSPMPTIGTLGYPLHIGHEPRPQRLQMQVAHQCEQVARFVTDQRFIAILQHMSAAPRAAINRPGMARQQRAHTLGQGLTSCADQQMKVIRQQGSGVHRGLRFGQPGQPLDDIPPIGVSLKDRLPLTPPRSHRVQHPGGIESGTTWHSAVLTITRISLHRPL